MKRTSREKYAGTDQFVFKQGPDGQVLLWLTSASELKDPFVQVSHVHNDETVPPTTSLTVSGPNEFAYDSATGGGTFDILAADEPVSYTVEGPQMDPTQRLVAALGLAQLILKAAS